MLIANRGELLKQPASYLAPLLGLVENGTFEVLKTLSSEDFHARFVNRSCGPNCIAAGFDFEIAVRDIGLTSN